MAGESHLRTGRNTQEDGLDPFVQGVVELIDGQADHAGRGAV
jgi:hypothetical protein